MNHLDIAVVSAYLVLLFSWAIYIGLRETAEDFLILSRRAPLFLVAFSVISTWVGTGTTVATAASAYDTGISLAFTAASGGLVGVVVAAWFAPRLKWFGDTFRAHTIGDFFAARYSQAARIASSLLILLIYVLLTAVQFVGLTTLLQVWTGVEFEVVVWFAAISTIIYTAFAGIKSDFYTDIIHFFVMFIVVFLILLPVTSWKIGGLGQLYTLPASYFDPFAYGGLSFFVAGICFGIGSVFVTMEVWQRVYASASGKNACIALVLSILVILCFYVVSAIFGMSARMLKPDLADRDQAIFFVMKNYLPVGVLGLGIAGFMAIFVSTINSTIMVASATLTKDFYKGVISRNADDRSVLMAGRISTFIVGIAGLIVAALFPDLVALSVNSLFMLLVLVPSIIGGFFWKKATSSAAITSISIGTLCMIGYLSVSPKMAFVPGFLTSLLCFIVVSYVSKHSKEECLTIVRGWVNKINKEKGVRIL